MSSIYGSLITALVGFFGAVIAIVSIRMQRKTSREKNALEFDVFYQTNEDIRSHWAVVVKYLNENKNRYDLKNIEKTDHVFISLIFILNTWERAANAIRYNVFDEDYLYNVLGGSAVRIHDEINIFIESRRAINKLVWVNYEWLVIRWRLRRKLNDENISNTENVLKLSSRFTPILRRNHLHSYEKKQLLAVNKYIFKIKHPFNVKNCILKETDLRHKKNEISE
ncbi:DUF4760 domain-containing protein [Pectobacterium versatile]|uniref:DUF4760 domain-containing protein n=1 Tax=Pectobacterium versatile TaxID=2488639 RepID=UPI001F2CD8F2|nr:DUF4760 domain-containing protein [Pectobacterium versatile]GKV82434.1 hypothetical protein PEC106664_32080 [Pectobacterium carotovorum subsp. carotovorum]